MDELDDKGRVRYLSVLLCLSVLSILISTFRDRCLDGGMFYIRGPCSGRPECNVSEQASSRGSNHRQDGDWKKHMLLLFSNTRVRTRSAVYGKV